MEEDLSIRVGARSHPGLVRTENQDRMGRFTSPFGELFVVADGMGGHRGGSTAAAMTVEGLNQRINQISPDTPVDLALKQAASETNNEVYEASISGDPEIVNMGSTLVAGILMGSRLFLGHAGDSRAYLFRNSELTRLTKDHSIVQKMVDDNILTEEQARNHPSSNVITNALGQIPNLNLEITGPVEMADGDRVLLCTDGLCGYVSDFDIESAIKKGGTPQEITDRLVELALAAGGEDNVTVQYIQFFAGLPHEQIEVEPADELETPPKPSRLRLDVLITVLIFLIIIFAWIYFMPKNG